jgi:hypothetical protein
LVHGRPDATLKEIRDRLGVACSLMTVVRALKKLGITPKKKILHDVERDTPEGLRKRAAFVEDVADVDPKHLVFVDETGTNTSMTRPYGRASKWERVEGAVPRSWTTLTLICGFRLSGATAPLIFPGATDTAAFVTYVERILAPQLRPDDVVVWDNLKPHKAPTVRMAVERTGARVIALPPSSPDYSPIEVSHGCGMHEVETKTNPDRNSPEVRPFTGSRGRAHEPSSFSSIRPNTRRLRPRRSWRRSPSEGETSPGTTPQPGTLPTPSRRYSRRMGPSPGTSPERPRRGGSSPSGGSTM